MLATGPTWAAGKARDISVESIRRFMEKGQALFVTGQYAKSAEVFETGFEMHPYSAFLFNAGVALEKAERLEDAILRFKRYLEVDGTVPDRSDVERRIERLEQAIATQKAAVKTEPKPTGAPNDEALDETKSLVLVETDPPGATLHFYRQLTEDARFEDGKDQPAFRPILTTQAPAEASLDVGRYHVTVDPFGHFNPSEADIEVLPGHVHQLKLNLSQGAFMAYLRVVVKPKHAFVYIDDPTREKSPWSQGTHGELVRTGAHQILVLAPGYRQFAQEIKLTEGQKEDLTVRLERLDYGELDLDSNAPLISVSVDGRAVGKWERGQPPLRLKSLRSGLHRLNITSPGRKPLTDTVMVPKGQVQTLSALMVVTPPRGSAWTQAVISGVLLGGGVYLGLESNRLYSELSSDRDAGVLARGDSRESRGKWFSIGADLAFVGSATLAGLATYNFIRDPLPPSKLKLKGTHEFDALTTDRAGAP